jgi:hypothetical protein
MQQLAFCKVRILLDDCLSKASCAWFNPFSDGLGSTHFRMVSDSAASRMAGSDTCRSIVSILGRTV